MAQNTSNILVGACNVAVGAYSADYVGTVDGLWTGIKTSVGGSNFRNWGIFRASNASGYLASVPVGSHSALAVGTCTFRDVGLTQEGVEIQYQPDFGEVEVDQILDAAKLFKQRMTVSAATTFAEATLDNLLTVWAQSASTKGVDSVGTGLALVPGELGQAPLEQALMFVGNAPGTLTTYKQRVYLASRALSVEASSMALRRSEATVFPVTFRLLPDTASSYSAYGRVIDVT